MGMRDITKERGKGWVIGEVKSGFVLISSTVSLICSTTFWFARPPLYLYVFLLLICPTFLLTYTACSLMFTTFLMISSTVFIFYDCFRFRLLFLWCMQQFFWFILLFFIIIVTLMKNEEIFNTLTTVFVNNESSLLCGVV